MTNTTALPELTPYTGTLADNILRIALDVGEGMLTCGAEVHRVEVAIEKICRTYGAAHIDVFTIHSLILAAAYMPDGSHSTQSRRIYETSNNLSRLELYNSLSRRICEETLSIARVDEEIREIKKERAYPFYLIVLAHALAAGSFAVFFGGSLRDGITAALIGVVMAFLDRVKIDQINKMVKTMLISFAAGLLSCLAVHIGLGENLDMIIIGTIMLLIPGLSLGNAMRDLLSGDTLTGTLKTVQAIITAIMMALGYALALLVAGGGL
ncbi:MAG: threonine/serine exporter family protein [Clostridia bacterium]|nr:threonine/serine exporter family protein [Clostridia bacterium]